jgi:SAM-dependent methyltransferase
MSGPSESPQLGTVRYYDLHAEEYAQSTQNLDLTKLYEPFLSLIPAGGHVLDAGCGSGRDALFFRNAGYQISAFDASPRMVELSSELLGQPVQLATFQTLEYDQTFDGIWACASLLHVPSAEMVVVLRRLRRALRPGGVLYASFKYGTEEGWEGQRYFSRYTEDRLRDALAGAGGWEIVRLWLTGDVRPERDEEKWVNLLAQRVG